MYQNIIKSGGDFIIALVLVILSLPIQVFIFFVLLYLNKGQVLFSQKRPGKNEEIFQIYKFKTMNDKKDKYGSLLSDEMRITRMGSFLRKSSLDELPQLYNVLKGQMSFVGPRPLLIEYLGLYNTFQKRRHTVRPGITGWAQINGRNAISWEEKFELDVWYVDNLNFLLDFKILVLTALRVFNSKDVNQSDHTTMEKFKGL